ncbi:nucleotide pyrophosphohydrolase [bacterium]|nr:nucleotide pyrophosphohydrolase [bacterium]MBT6293704.1 nucleotide pyrophosphohydrolase [bacterium]
MSIKRAQEKVDNWIKEYGVRYFDNLTNLGVLMEEVGELSRVMTRLHGEQSFKKSDQSYNLADEMADILFVLICLANQNNINLEEAFKENLKKKTNRDSQRHKENKKLT